MQHRHLARTLGALGILSLILVACSNGDDDDDATGPTGGSGPKTVAVRMVDNDFDPSALSVKQGDTVTFRFTNQGTIDHDAFVGTPEEQTEHEAEMADDADMADQSSTSMSGSMSTSSSTPMGDGSEEPSGSDEGVVVPPGETGELTYTFDKAGVFEIGCHEPGHYDSGMKVHIVVED